MSNQTSAITLDRLEKALSKKGISLKRQALLEIASQAFGFRDGNAFSAAAKKGSLNPQKTSVIRTVTIGGSSHAILGDENGHCLAIVPCQTPEERSDRHALSYQGVMLQLPEHLSAYTSEDDISVTLQKIKSSLDNFTALPGDEDYVGQAELAVIRAIDCHEWASSHVGVSAECSSAEELLQSVSQNSPGYEHISNAIHHLGQLRSENISTSINNSRNHALQRALDVIDEEIENRKSSGDPAYWAELQSVWEEGNRALNGRVKGNTCKRCDSNLKDDRCQDETCPFSEVSQQDPKGWAGHPEAPRFIEHAKPLRKSEPQEFHAPMDVLWMTDIYGDDAYGVEAADMHRHNLSYEVIDGAFSALNAQEKAVLHPNTILNSSTKFPARLGASALSDGKKYLCPVIEFKFDNHSTEQAAHKAASAYAKSIKDQVEGIGGIVFIDDEMESDHCDVCVFIPMTILIDTESDDRIKALSYLLLPKESRASMPSLTCDFLAQAWLDGNPISVDPDGDTSWDATFNVLLNRTEIESIIDNDDIPIDILHLGPGAPEWIRQWTGPCDLYYDEDVMEKLIRG